MRIYPPVVLCGFMGCGKTSIGQAAARKLGMEFIDADAYIEKQAGMKVSEIFARYGEEGFREREHQAMKELARKTGCIIASGGGAMTFERNVKAVEEKAVIIYLETPFEECCGRILGDKSRPLAAGGDKEALYELYQKREGLYRKAAQRTVINDGTLNHAVVELTRVILEASAQAREQS